MRTRLLGTIAIAALALTACGGDDDGGGGGDQDVVADRILASADDEGLELDADCVRDVAGKLSDDDAAKMVEAGVDGNPELSADAEALSNEMFSCFDTDALVDQIVAEMGGEGVDADCLKRVLDDQGVESLDSGAIFECIDLGAIDTDG